MSERVIEAADLFLEESHLSVYQWAIQNGQVDARSLAQEFDFDFDTAVSVVKVLRDRNFLFLDGAILRPHSPAVAMAHVVGPIEAEVQHCRLRLSEIRSKLSHAARLSEVPVSGTTGMEIIGDIHAVRSEATRLTEEAEKEITVMHPAVPSERIAVEGSLRMEEALRRGVSVRSLYSHACLGHRYMHKYLDEMTGLGMEVRTNTGIPNQVIVFDGETALVSTGAPGEGGGALVLRQRELIGVLHCFWEALWDTGAPYSTVQESRYEDTKQRVRTDILRMLEAGLSDREIAQRLSVSVRTLGRHISELYEDLGVRSRFQMGSRARQLGWLEGTGSLPPALI